VQVRLKKRRAATRLESWVEGCLWAIGFLALAAWSAVWVNARRQQAEGSRELDHRLEMSRNGEAASVHSRLSSPAKGDLIGRIEIPRLQMSTVVFEGTVDDVLRVGVGHLSGSPLPGERGNVVLAAHRDTFFRPLRNIHNKDTIVVITPSGTRRYSVYSMAIVTPDRIEMLGPTPGAVLTLVTCYPFDWFGHAPKRFVVRARELDPTELQGTRGAMRAQTSSEESEVMAGVDHQPRVHSPMAHATPATPRATAHSQLQSVRPRTDGSLLAVETAEEPGGESALSAARTDGAEASAAVQEPTAPAIEADPTAPVHDPGNRMARALKKLNPKRLLARIAGR
jgi:sortase A